jgi:hypothetical protein
VTPTVGHVRRFVVLVLATVLTLPATACGADGGGAVEAPQGDDRAEFVTSRDRWIEACRRVAADDVADGCADVIDRAIDAAVDATCSIGSLDAFVEVGISRSFSSVPGDRFFESCPGPLASLVIVDPPAGYEQVEVPLPDLGLLDTAGVAEAFVDREAMANYLDEIGHQVSYARRWQRGGEAALTVRLDRFDDVEAAAHFTAWGPDELDDDRVMAVLGVNDGRIRREAFDGDDGRERVRQVAFGRVCDIAISVVVRSDEEPWVDRELEELFVVQVHRVRAVRTC